MNDKVTIGDVMFAVKWWIETESDGGATRAAEDNAERTPNSYIDQRIERRVENMTGNP